jgi:6-phosphogluconolactonase/glucosamine-6-phosphate isomerase/deaminase
MRNNVSLTTAILKEQAMSRKQFSLGKPLHLGLGPDGHTASLVPDDPVLLVADASVAVTAPYQGHPRMTLTFPVLDRARRVLWVVTGSEKVAMLARLANGDRGIPAGRVNSARAVVLADAAAAGKPR